jgi:hypothetical protein
MGTSTQVTRIVSGKMAMVILHAGLTHTHQHNFACFLKENNMTQWKHKINIKQHLGTETGNEAIVKAALGISKELRKLPVSIQTCPDFGVADILFEFSEMAYCAHDPEDNESLLEEFNYNLNELYDWADDNRVWLGL